MKQIIKIQPPKSFIEFCNKPHTVYDGSDFPKDDLRQSLLTEQGHICCYCMKRIPETTAPYMKIEHFKSQSDNQNLQLKYSNLLGACIGNEGQPTYLETCDTKKKKLDFSLDPCSNPPNCDYLFKYTIDGEITCNDANLKSEIDSTLNLNNQSLKDSRAQVYKHIHNVVKAESKKNKDKKLKIKYFEALLSDWLTPNNTGKLKPFCMVAVYYLNKKIRQNQN